MSFDYTNSRYKKEIEEYLQNGGKIRTLPPQDNPQKITAQVKVGEEEEDEIYLTEGWSVLNPDGSGWIRKERGQSD